MFTYQGKTALITGASSGIGEAFASSLAERGTNLILVARSQDRLQSLAHYLSQTHGIRVEVLSMDLSQDHAATTISEEVQARGLTVDLLVNNAAFGTYGPFETLSAQREHQEILVNVAAVVAMTHAFLPAMVERGDGAIINVASLAAFQPYPYMTVYGASKAFVLSFSEALWAENRTRGVRVLALCPGPVKTRFFETMGCEELAVGTPLRRSSTQVVEAALHALARGRSSVVPGWSNALLSQSSRFLPRAFVAQMTEKLFRPRKGKIAAPVHVSYSGLQKDCPFNSSWIGSEMQADTRNAGTIQRRQQQ